ncbi:hypothetical protein [Sporosarcina sp. FSL K6-5500]|uniref:hypothetical protein n=1 Tax=Sporosarcina sp. FSL K6-5500 TaxID=2921558 RepID=UPI0030F7DBB9
MSKVTNHKKSIKKNPRFKDGKPSSISIDTVIENQQSTIVPTTLVETEEIKLNETQRLELETFEQEPNMATETDMEGQADLEATSDGLPQNSEPEPPTLPLNSTTKLPELVEDELESVSESELEPKVTSAKDEPIPDEVSVSKVYNTLAQSYVEEKLSSIEQDDSLLDTAIATTYNITKSRQMNAALTVVNHKTGKRNKIGKDVCDELELTEGSLVDVFVKDQSVLICKSTNGQGHTLSKGNIIYNKELVEMITEACQLDFEGRSSNSLTQVKYVQSQGRKVAVIS